MKVSPNQRPFRFSLGDQGEILACNYLRQAGYEILEKNFRCKVGEIDVVAKRKGKISFVEIKTRTSAAFGYPQEAVDKNKQKKLLKLAAWYLKKRKIADHSIVFDVIAICWEKGKEPTIRLIKDAFEKKDKDY